MLIDFDDADAPRDLVADVCIIGAGAAGIAVALGLSETGHDVCLLEGGGLEYEAETQALYEGTAVGVPWACHLHDCRLRQFGGTTSGDWGGGCAPLDDLDFGPREWVPYSGWPITKAELYPYYERARKVFRIGPDPFEDQELLNDLLLRIGHRPLSFEPSALVSRYYLKSPLHFGTAYRGALTRAPNITTLLHANVVSLDADPMARQVSAVRFKALSGKTGIVKPRAVILACGGIEVPRLLLDSDSVEPHGLGNRHDLVGRFFMDHPSGPCATVITSELERLVAAYDHSFHWRRLLPIYPTLCLSEAAQERDRLLNARYRLTAREDDVPDGILAVRELLAHGRRREIPGDVGHQLRRILKDLGHVVVESQRRIRRRRELAGHQLIVEGVFEQAPNPASRITLSDDRDALGQRRARLDWQLTDLDWRTYQGFVDCFDRELKRQRLGHIEIADWVRSGHSPEIRGVAHHLGTTRMSDDPRSGVVDRDCRVHGVANLFVSSGAVFPTGGFAGPTFTIVALGLRLVDHLKEWLDRVSRSRAEVFTAAQ